MKHILPYLTKQTLDNLNCGVYSYNVTGDPELFINKFCLEHLGTINKVYKTSISQIIHRVIHPDDQELGLVAVKTIAENPNQVFIHFRRFLINESEYKWMFVINGANEMHDDGRTKRIISYATFINSDLSDLEKCIEDIELIGFDISPQSLKHQLGQQLSEDFMSILAEESSFKRNGKEIKTAFNIPDFWTPQMIKTFFKTIPIKEKLVTF